MNGTPHLHISGINAIITVLYVLVVLGTLNLIAMKFQDRSKLAASYANLFGLQ